ncbi:MAG TPA: hypothetical protein PLJ44_10380, partial [Victivallales bacterium]|nr:hypothetical protein [Victivallales bacterium]
MKKELSKNYKPFIDDNKLENLCEIHENASAIKDVIAKSMEKNPLSIEETAILLAAKSQDLKETIFNAARELKKNV